MAYIGTQNNKERTYGRDLGFSAIMRLPRNIRVCDEDAPEVAPYPICNRCALPILKIEASREDRDVWTHSRYRRAEMEKFGIPAFYVRHDISDEEGSTLRGRITNATRSAFLKCYGQRTVVVTTLKTMVVRQDTIQKFVAWLEKRADRHAHVGCDIFEPKRLLTLN